MNKSEIAERDDAATALPRPLRITAAISWRLLVIGGALYVLGIVMSRVYVVVIPVAIALLLAALLAPAVGMLTRLRVPRSLSTAVVLVAGLAAVGGVLTFVINAFIEGFPDLQRQVLRSIDGLRMWLSEGPLHLNDEQLTGYVNQAQQWIASNQQALTSGALSTAGTFGNFLTGLVLALFTLIFFLFDGRRVWLFTLGLVPRDVRAKVDRAGCRGFESLVGYVRATALVACVDAIGIGLGLTILQVPLAIPLAALVFLGGFVPIVGAVASGAVAVLVALVTNGWIVALIVLGVVLAVQQLEGNVLQPLLLGRAVQIHPLAIVLAISVGVVVSGIIGALLAVPICAVLNSAVRSLLDDEDEPVPADASPPGQAPPTADAEASDAATSDAATDAAGAAEPGSTGDADGGSSDR